MVVRSCFPTWIRASNLLPLVAVAGLSGCFGSEGITAGYVSPSDLVDRTGFGGSRCMGGERLGFSGVQVVNPEGRRLRLVAEPDGHGTAILFERGAAVGKTFKDCGEMTIEQTGPYINDHPTIQGRAVMHCEGLRGVVEFRCGPYL